MAVALIYGLTLELNDSVKEYRSLDEQLSTWERVPANEKISAQIGEALERQAEVKTEIRTQRSRASLHLLLGLAASLGVVFVSSLAVTYFIGTSRWCREVVETYSLNSDLVIKSQQLKRRSFPWALTAILSVLAVGALGAASDPGTGNLQSGFWATPHLIAAFLGVPTISASFCLLWKRIAANHELIETIMQHVADARASREAAV